MIKPSKLGLCTIGKFSNSKSNASERKKKENVKGHTSKLKFRTIATIS